MIRYDLKISYMYSQVPKHLFNIDINTVHIPGDYLEFECYNCGRKIMSCFNHIFNHEYHLWHKPLKGYKVLNGDKEYNADERFVLVEYYTYTNYYQNVHVPCVRIIPVNDSNNRYSRPVRKDSMITCNCGIDVGLWSNSEVQLFYKRVEYKCFTETVVNGNENDKFEYMVKLVKI